MNSSTTRRAPSAGRDCGTGWPAPLYVARAGPVIRCRRGARRGPARGGTARENTSSSSVTPSEIAQPEDHPQREPRITRRRAPRGPREEAPPTRIVAARFHSRRRCPRRRSPARRGRGCRCRHAARRIAGGREGLPCERQVGGEQLAARRARAAAAPARSDRSRGIRASALRNLGGRLLVIVFLGRRKRGRLDRRRSPARDPLLRPPGRSGARARPARRRDPPPGPVRSRGEAGRGRRHSLRAVSASRISAWGNTIVGCVASDLVDQSLRERLRHRTLGTLLADPRGACGECDRRRWADRRDRHEQLLGDGSSRARRSSTRSVTASGTGAASSASSSRRAPRSSRSTRELGREERVAGGAGLQAAPQGAE